MLCDPHSTLVWNILIALDDHRDMRNCRYDELSDQVFPKTSCLHKDLKVINSFKINLDQIQALSIGVQILENSKVHNFEHSCRNVRKKYTLRIFSENVYNNVVQHSVYEDACLKILPSIPSCLFHSNYLLLLRTSSKTEWILGLENMHGLATSSCCHISQGLPVPMPMNALGKEGTSFLQDTGGGRKGDQRKEL